MTDRPRNRWWNGVTVTTPVERDDNVVHMPKPTLDELERQLIDAQNAVISAGIECDRAAMIYKDKIECLTIARSRFADRLKESGAKIEFVTTFPSLD